MKNSRKSFIVLSILLASILVSCEDFSLTGIRGQGEIIEQEFVLEDFDEVCSSISANVHITYGAEKKVVIKGQQNIIDNIETDVRGGKWEIEFKHKVRNYDGLDIYITTNNLTDIELSGSGDLTSTNLFESLNPVEYSISGSGDIDFRVKAPSVKTSISGSGDIELYTETTDLESIISGSGEMDFSGIAQNLGVIISGSGDVSAFALATENCEVSISGSGNCSMFASKKLDVSISGSGNVYYKGTPQVSVNISGLGKLVSRN